MLKHYNAKSPQGQDIFLRGSNSDLTRCFKFCIPADNVVIPRAFMPVGIRSLQIGITDCHGSSTLAMTEEGRSCAGNWGLEKKCGLFHGETARKALWGIMLLPFS
jgi:hypothetical protein